LLPTICYSYFPSIYKIDESENFIQSLLQPEKL